MTQNEANLQSLHLGQYAGFVSRLAAFVIDWLIVLSVIGVATAVAGFVTEVFDVNTWLGLEQHANWLMAAILAIVSVSVVLVYFLGAWMLSGQTVGKWIMGLRIVRTDGGRLRFGNCIRRYLGYWASTILFLGFIWILIDNRRQGFHDKLAGTIVLYAWPEAEGTPRPIRDHVRHFRAGRRPAQEVDHP